MLTHWLTKRTDNMRQPHLTHRRYRYKTPQKISTVKNLVRMCNRRRRSCKTKKNKKWGDCEILKRDMVNWRILWNFYGFLWKLPLMLYVNENISRDVETLISRRQGASRRRGIKASKRWTSKKRERRLPTNFGRCELQLVNCNNSRAHNSRTNIAVGRSNNEWLDNW